MVQGEIGSWVALQCVCPGAPVTRLGGILLLLYFPWQFPVGDAGSKPWDNDLAVSRVPK